MKTVDFNFFDKPRSRKVPVAVYISEKQKTPAPTVIFSPGYQGQRDLRRSESLHKRYVYLAEYFVKQGFAFITIQHDLLGDKDGIKTINTIFVEHNSRKHLYERGISNILFALNALSAENLPLILDKFIISGHSNGGDISKYFISKHPKYSSQIVLFDSRRVRLRPKSPINLLMFEADDTSTDLGVLPDQQENDGIPRSDIDWTVVKPIGALHVSYLGDHVTDLLKAKIFKALDAFLENSPKLQSQPEL